MIVLCTLICEDPVHYFTLSKGVVVVVSRFQRIGCQPEKTTLHDGQSRSWSVEQGKEKKKKEILQHPSLSTLLVQRK